MRSIYKITFAIIILSISLLAQTKEKNSLNVDAGAFSMTGDNTDGFETGYSLGFGYEHRFTQNFGLEILPVFSYVYMENEVPFFGVYVDTYVMGISVTPKLYIPVGGGAFQFVLAPRASYSYVNNQVEVWYEYYTGNYNFAEKDVKTSYSQGVFSFGGLAGFEVSLSQLLSLGVNVYYDSLDLNEGMKKVDWANDTNYENNIKTSRLGIMSTFKFSF